MIARYLFSFLLVLGALSLLVSCATEQALYGSGNVAKAPAMTRSVIGESAKKPGTIVDDGRIRIHRATQTVEVAEVEPASVQIGEWTKARNGYVESSRESEDDSSSASFTIRIPAEHLEAILDQFASLGKQTSRRVNAEDTTDAYHDLQAQIRNTEALRDRLRRLLDEAEEVKEVLEIEKQLARVQTELDSMKGRFQRMDSQVRLATIDLHIQTQKIPGPVGAANKGLWWGIKKLFVLN